MIQLEFAITGCLVEHEGKFLIVQESKPGREGLYNLPSGHIDELESVAEATIREVKEETGYEVELTGFLGVYQSIYPTRQLNVCGPIFLGKVTGGSLQTSADHPDVKWVSGDELQTMADNGQFWTTYPPLLVKDYRRRGKFPLELMSTNIYE